MELKLKIPPAVVAALCIGLMWALNNVIAIGYTPLPGNRLVAGMLLLGGGIFGVAALYEFYRNGTSLDPHKPTKASHFVTSGIYQVSRNPMYVALFFILLAYATALQNIVNLLVLPLFVWYMNRFQILPEEEVMEKKFGDAYRNYKTEVNRWL